MSARIIPVIEPLHPLQIAAWRRMSYDEKRAVSEGLLQTARALTSDRVRAGHPDWNEAQVQHAVSRHFLHAHT